MGYLPAKAHRLDRLPTYDFAVIGQRIAELTSAGKDVIRLDIGSPDMAPPDAVIEALKKSADNPTLHSYGSYTGDPAYRKAVAGYYERHYGISLNPMTEVMPLIGSKEGLVNLTMAYLDRGDYALVPDIAYPTYGMGALLAGGDVIHFTLDPQRGYLPDFKAIEASTDLSHAKLLWLNYPNNPTGAVADLAFYEEAVAFCRKHHLLLCSDNPYADIVFDGYKTGSPLQVPGARDCTVEFFSMSKTYNMAGWRIGACVGNSEALAALLTVKSNIDSGHFRPIYDASTVALNTTPDSWIAERNAVYERRRDHILDVLPEIGLVAEKPAATLYIWASVPDGDDHRYIEQALNEAQVSIAPGSIYGPGGHGYVRLSVTTPDKRLDEALARLREWHKVKA